jgi:hypothetical protein
LRDFKATSAALRPSWQAWRRLLSACSNRSPLSAVGPAIARLSRFMVEASTGGTAQIETMNKLGLSYAQLKNLTPTEQMRMLAKSIMALPTPAERTAAAMDIFGKSGRTLIPLFANFSGET